jgi:hypothetical protein
MDEVAVDSRQQSAGCAINSLRERSMRSWSWSWSLISAEVPKEVVMQDLEKERKKRED